MTSFQVKRRAAVSMVALTAGFALSSFSASAAELTFQTQPTVSVGSEPVAIAVGDVNQDGRADFITANRAGNSLSARFALGDGTFVNAGETDLGANATPLAVTLSDINGDQLPDILTAKNGSVGMAGSIAILRNGGKGTFSSLSSLVATNFKPTALAVGAVTTDSLPDVIAVGQTTGGNSEAQLFEGSNPGTFYLPGSLPVAMGSRAVSLGDINGDHLTDFVTANYGAATVSVYQALPAGGFSPKAPLATPAQTTGVAAADLNKDGKSDLVVSARGANTLGVYLATSSGSFAPRTDLQLPSGAAAVVAGDLNKDGNLDLVTANSSTGDLSVFSGNGNGSFQSRLDLKVAGSPMAVALGDINGDSTIDLVAANVDANSVSVLTNVTPGLIPSPPVNPVQQQTPPVSQQTPPNSREAQCAVPSLIGLSLPAAKKSLTAAGCKLGKVLVPKRSKRAVKKLKRKGYRLVVGAQSRKAKTMLAVNTKIDLQCAWRKAKKK